MDIDKLGANIKKIRLESGLSIKDLAEMVGVSSSLLSQIERGLANPSLTTLRSIAVSLQVPMFSLFLDSIDDQAILVKKENRIRITSSGPNSELELGYDLLSPDLKGDIQMCEMELGPNQFSSDKMFSHDAEEVTVCIKGTIEIHLENQVFALDEGDSIRIERGTPHKYKNPTDRQASLIFAISPPIF